MHLEIRPTYHFGFNFDALFVIVAEILMLSIVSCAGVGHWISRNLVS